MKENITPVNRKQHEWRTESLGITFENTGLSTENIGHSTTSILLSTFVVIACIILLIIPEEIAIGLFFLMPIILSIILLLKGVFNGFVNTKQ